MFKSLLFFLCKSTAGWAIRVDGKILASWVHADKYVLDSAARLSFASPEYTKVEVVPVRIFSLL